jgi:hypothetical protein
MVESGDTDLEPLWQTVLDNWEDAKAHEAFVQACHQSASLGLAAASYRSVIDGPGNDRKAAAQKRLGMIALLATQGLESTRQEPRRGVPRWVTILAAAFTASALGWLIFTLVR